MKNKENDVSGSIEEVPVSYFNREHNRILDIGYSSPPTLFMKDEN